MKPKHTPGPWLIRRSLVSSTVNIETKHGLVIAEVGDSSKEDEANAILIAAAPDMLQALRRAALALAFAAESSPAMRDDYEAVSAAIAKVTGSAS